MQRCAPALAPLCTAACAVAALMLLSTALPAAAQAPRNFSAQALRGELLFTQPPEVLLNRQPARLAPGARIRGADNLLQMSGALVGQRMAVHYTRDLNGQLLDVWLLTPQELARQPWPTTPVQAQTWLFNPDLQSWSPR